MVMIDTISEKVQQAAALIKQSSYVVAFSGAGISTESGIPDFRSEKSGLWNRDDPMEVASLHGFRRNPKAFYDWVRPLARVTLDAEPNAAHYSLARLEELGFLKSVITQNIDMLHTRAGSSTVYELHGHMREGTCIGCYKKYDGQFVLDEILKHDNVPYCPACDAPIKPDVILFGEQLPYQAFNAAEREMRKADLMIVIGSSLEVAPAGDIPLHARRHGAKLIIVNLEPTPVDSLANVVLHAWAGETMEAIVEQLETLL
jgi:NAD-dependent deacetylase